MPTYLYFRNADTTEEKLRVDNPMLTDFVTDDRQGFRHHKKGYLADNHLFYEFCREIENTGWEPLKGVGFEPTGHGNANDKQSTVDWVHP